MKNIGLNVLLSLALMIGCSAALADSIVASYSCELKDGKTPEELQAANSKWLKWVRTNVNENIESSVGNAVVGKLDHFIFVDTYPDLATWAATQTALDSDAASELENLLDDIAECTENRLWRLEPTQ